MLPVDYMAMLDDLVKEHGAGDEVELVIIREGQRLTLNAIIDQLSTAESGGQTATGTHGYEGN